MPEIVEVDRRKPRALEQSGKVPADGPRVEWCAEGTGEHPVTRDPAIPGYQPGGGLGRLLPPEGRYRCRRGRCQPL